MDIEKEVDKLKELSIKFYNTPGNMLNFDKVNNHIVDLKKIKRKLVVLDKESERKTEVMGILTRAITGLEKHKKKIRR